MPGPRILILTVSHGAAHRRVSHALREALLSLRPELEVKIADALEHCAGWFRAYYDSYEIPLKYWPGLWGWIESLQHSHASTGPGWLYRQGARPLFRFLQAFDPDIVIATEVGVCELTAMFKRKTRARYLLVGATAGVDVDRPWVQDEVDLYPIGPPPLSDQLSLAGAPAHKILPCGIPISPAFGLERDRAKVRSRLGVKPDTPLLLVLFGGSGWGKPRRMVEELKELNRPLEAVFIAGKNKRLEQQLSNLCRDLPQFRVLGWVENMHEWMTAADLLVSKPGGMTVVEAINSGLPLLALDPLPGAERRSCDLIESWEVGKWVRRTGELAQAVASLLDDRKTLEGLRANALRLARPQAARDAAEAILRLAGR